MKFHKLIFVFTLFLTPSIYGADYIHLSRDELLQLVPERIHDFDEADGDLLLKIQKEASPKAVELAKKQDHFSIWAYFSEVMGAQYQEKKLPQTAIIFSRISKEIGEVSNFLKDKYSRPRPPVGDVRVKALVPIPKNPSYPSGHSMTGMAWALILSDLRPDLKEQLFDYGRGMGWHRIVIGVHYPTDVISGFRLGRALGADILASTQYKADRPKIVAEWKKLGLLK
jgi:acid phosphatase (class A)